MMPETREPITGLLPHAALGKWGCFGGTPMIFIDLHEFAREDDAGNAAGWRLRGRTR